MPDPLRLLRSDRLIRRSRPRPDLPARPRRPRSSARTWDVSRTLSDGTPVRIRSITPDDAETVRAGMAELSERSRYLRFHAPIVTLSEAHVRHLVEVDHVAHEALVAEVADPTRPDGRRGLGIARYVDAGDGVPEFAIVVIDEAQHRGVGRVLLRELFAAARRAGYTEVQAEVLAENTAMLRLLEQEADELRVSRDGSVMHVTARIVRSAVTAA